MWTIFVIFGLMFLRNDVSSERLVRHLRRREKQELVKESNRLRSLFATGAEGFNVSNMNELHWSRKLEFSVHHLIERMDEVTADIPQTLLLKLNVVSLTTRNVTSGLNTWYSEKSRLLPALDVCLYLEECSRFLTMMNAEHRRVGCAYQVPTQSVRSSVRPRRRQYKLVCLYEGGDLKIPAYERGDPCTRCTEKQAFCNNGLCVTCSEKDWTKCDCRKTCSKAMVGSGWLDTQTCTCTCHYGHGPNCDAPCQDPVVYTDWDICAELPDDICQSPSEMDRAMLAEFCPTKCSCTPYPGTGNS